MQTNRNPGATLGVAAAPTTPDIPRARATSSRPDDGVAGTLTVERYARLWIEEYSGRTSRGLDQSTRHDYRRSLELHALPTLGPLRLQDVTPRDIREVILGLERAGQAPSSVSKNLAPVRAMLATAVEEGLIIANPGSAVRIAGRRADYEDRERRILTRAEIAVFFGGLPAQWHLFFGLLLHTGVRISEAVGLRWDDITLDDQPHVRIRRQVCRGRVKAPKSRYGRRDIPLSPGMTAALVTRRDSEAKADLAGQVFRSASGGCLDVSNVRRRVLAPAAERAGIGRIGFHTFRHTCASLLFAAGKDLKQVQHWLGHHDPAFTLSTYIHLLDGGLGDADFLDELSPGS
jgi:integrase